jgi:hypothetical protein
VRARPGIGAGDRPPEPRVAGRARPTLAAAAVAATIALGIPAGGAEAQGPLGSDGARAFQMARAADDAALDARDEGERLRAELERLAADSDRSEALEPFRIRATEAHQALGGYRRQAQASATEALALLAELARGSRPGPGIDPSRRDVVQQRALLAAHEATVMAARTRTEAERLRALVAETRLTLATVRPATAAAGGGDRPRLPAAGEVVVPNLVGARLDAATRDLAAAGLQLGATTGPADGFVVKQEPEAGTAAARRTPVAVTLSATAAGVSGAPGR